MMWTALALQAACVPPAAMTPPARGGGSAPVARAPSSPANDAQAVHAAVNRHRQSRGCAPLVWSEGAARAAQRHSEDMVRRRYFSHTSPDGTQPWDRMRAQGLSFTRAAENIAMNGGGAEATVRGWINSPGHRANIENCALTHTGVGVAGSYWTQVFFTAAGG
jgi:uncharacterized protein YkwD